MADKTIRVGFVGAGGNCRLHHIPKLKAQPGVEIVAVANRSKESGEKVAKEFGIARVATDWRDGGLILRRGSPSSHVAILARSRGVPMIVGVDIDHLESGVDAVLDGDAGTLIVDPDPM